MIIVQTDQKYHTKPNVMIQDGKKEKHNVVKTASIDNSSKHRQKIESNHKLFWINEFSEELNLLELPTDFKRPPVKGYKCDSISFELTREETGKLKSISDETGATMYMVLLSAYNIFLSKLSNQEDIIVGVPVTVADHMNTLPLRNYPKGNLTFRDFLSDLKQRTLACFDHKSYAYEDLIDTLKLKHDISRNPLFDVMFLFQNIDNPEYSIPGVGFHSHSRGHGIAKFDLTLSVDLTLLATETDGKLYLAFEYSTELFKQETIERFITYFHQVISFVISDSDLKMSEIDVITNNEKYLILNVFNNTKVNYPVDTTIAELFEEQVKSTPKAIAVVYEDKVFTYEALNERADKLAAYLIKNGVKQNTLVGIMANRSSEMIIGMLGILKAGGAYVPIDAGYPRERINYIIRDCDLKILLTLNAFKGMCNFDGEFVLLDNPDLYQFKIERYTSQVKEGMHMAYVMYTSGSTGYPKGVIVTHKNVIRLVKNSTIIPYSNRERFMQTGNPVFDATTFEIWGSLLNGSALYLASNDVIIDSSKLRNFLYDNKISVLWLTASLFNQHVDHIPNMFQYLKYLLVGGDALSPKHINIALKFNPSISIINGYGPTENTTFSTTYKIKENHIANIPIGKPITNSTVYILSSSKLLQPIGVPGELCVGGDGVAMGYLNNKELTDEKFINNPFVPNDRMYKTGDLARWLPDGNIEFLGRIDNQVKIRGFRIELGEIESHLSNYEKIKKSFVTAKEQDGEKYLIAYYESDTEIEVLKLRTYLLQRLPQHMVPAFFIHLVNFPLTSNGKIDRKALPDLELKAGDEYVAPTTELEMKLVAIWAESLCINKEVIGIHHNFFMLGGNSLNAIKTVQKIKTIIPDISTNDIFIHPTIYQLETLSLKKYSNVNQKFSNVIEIENKLKKVFHVEAQLIKYVLPKKTFVILFINKTEIIVNRFFKKFIVSELEDKYQPHYIVKRDNIPVDIQNREIQIGDKAFFSFIRKMNLLDIY